MSNYHLTKEGVREIADLLNKTDEVVELLRKTVNNMEKRNFDIQDIKQASDLQAKYLMILADNLENSASSEKTNQKELEKTENNKTRKIGYSLESIIEQLKNASQEVNAVKMRDPPKWLSKENQQVKELISKASNKLAELVIARLLTQNKKINYSEIIKGAPLSQSKTAKVLKKMVNKGRVEKNREGRKVFYSLK